MTLTLSKFLCWIPGDTICLFAMILSGYPIDMVTWTTGAVGPIYSLLTPSVFVVFCVRNYLKWRNKSEKPPGVVWCPIHWYASCWWGIIGSWCSACFAGSTPMLTPFWSCQGSVALKPRFGQTPEFLLQTWIAGVTPYVPVWISAHWGSASKIGYYWLVHFLQYGLEGCC